MREGNREPKPLSGGDRDFYVGDLAEVRRAPSKQLQVTASRRTAAGRFTLRSREWL